MSNLIDKEVAIQNVKELFSMGECYCDELSIIGMLNALPSIKTEQKQGKWRDITTKIGWPRYKCSECGSSAGSVWMNFCPNCGAYMRGEK